MLAVSSDLRRGKDAIFDLNTLTKITEKRSKNTLQAADASVPYVGILGAL